MKKYFCLLILIIILVTICGCNNNTIIPDDNLDTHVDADGTLKEQHCVGDVVKFGSYPQKLITDDSIISNLEQTDGKWVSYNYYLEDKISDYMQYKDVVCNGKKYRGVRFSQYRAFHVGDTKSIQSDNGYYTNKTYWFEFLPCEWIVLDKDKGLLLSKYVLDSQNFNYSNNYYFDKPYYDKTFESIYYIDSTKQTYFNDYGISYIRKFLNEQFYNTAFSDVDKKIIKANDNLIFGVSYGDTTTDSYTTNDTVFLLSKDEVKNDEYKLKNDSGNKYEMPIITTSTDYAKSQGVNVNPSDENCSVWGLRDFGKNSDLCCGVDLISVNSEFSIVSTDMGVRPAVYIDLSKID